MIDDPELAAIAAELRKTAGYDVNPQFYEQLRQELLADFGREARVLFAQTVHIYSLYRQLQEQYNLVGKVSIFAGYMNVQYLRSELWELGYHSRLAEDEKTIILEKRKEIR